jgi:hypothetical protein
MLGQLLFFLLVNSMVCAQFSGTYQRKTSMMPTSTTQLILKTESVFIFKFHGHIFSDSVEGTYKSNDDTLELFYPALPRVELADKLSADRLEIVRPQRVLLKRRKLFYLDAFNRIRFVNEDGRRHKLVLLRI